MGVRSFLARNFRKKVQVPTKKIFFRKFKNVSDDVCRRYFEGLVDNFFFAAMHTWADRRARTTCFRQNFAVFLAITMVFGSPERARLGSGVPGTSLPLTDRFRSLKVWRNDRNEA